MTFRDSTLRLRPLVAPRAVDRELDDELAFHVECETRKQIAKGVDAADALDGHGHHRAGLGVVTVAFTFFNAFFFRVDAVRTPTSSSRWSVADDAGLGVIVAACLVA